MQRGEIWWAALAKPSGRRPVLILTRNPAVQVRENITVAEITTSIRQIPSEVPLHKHDGMPKECVVNLDVINTISKKWLEEKIITVNTDKMRIIDKVLKYVLSLS